MPRAGMTAWCPTRAVYSSVAGEVTACHTSIGAIGFGIRVRSWTVEPRSGIPGGGSTKCLPVNEKRSLYQASLMISIDSSKISRLTRSSSADISLSPDATTPPSDCASRGTVPRPTPNCIRLLVRICIIAASSARRRGCHCGTILNICPRRRRSVSFARCNPNKMRFGVTS